MRLPILVLLFATAFAAAPAALKTDIEYANAGGESLRLDAYTPDGPGPFPAVILVHGGGWTAGDKSGGPKKGYMAPMQDPLSRAGFAWFTINYRLAPKHPYPACIEDVEAAIRWVKAHAAEFHVDPARIALSGESAGGHLVALAAVRADESTRVAAVVPFYGPFNMTNGTPGQALPTSVAALTGRTVFDDETKALLTSLSPYFHVKPGLPPFLLVHGTADQSVDYQQSIAFQKKLKEAGVPCDLLTVPGGAHGMVSWDKNAPHYKDDVVAWLVKTLREGQR